MDLARPSVVAFDLVETVFSLAPVAAALDEATGRSGLLPRWFDRVLRDGFARSLSRAPLPFPDVAMGALEVVAPDLDVDARQRILAAFTDLPAQPDVRPAFDRLAAEDVTVLGVTNSGAEGARRLLAKAGLDQYVASVISVDEVGTWKPHPDVYRHLVTSVGREPREVAFVAVHAWDIHGAGSAGLTTGWASRLEGRFASSYRPADVQGDDLVEVVDELLRLPGGNPPTDPR